MVLWQVANEGTLGADNMGSYIVLPSCLVSPLSQWWLKMLEVILDGGSLFVTDGTLQAISSVRHSDNLEQSGTTWQKSRSSSSWSRNVFTELQLELETAAKKNSDEKKKWRVGIFFWNADLWKVRDIGRSVNHGITIQLKQQLEKNRQEMSNANKELRERRMKVDPKSLGRQWT